MSTWMILAACSQPTAAPFGDPSEATPEQHETPQPAPEAPSADPNPGCTPAAALAINELCPANEGSWLDVEGDAVDWIELYNADAVPVDVNGWTLSDDPDEPGKWTFPSTTIEPGEFLLVQASGKDRVRIVGSWDTRIDQGDPWRYLPVSSRPDAGWMQPDYDDGDWDIGPSGFGRGDSDDATRVSTPTAYIRTELELTAGELADLVALVLHVDYDDAFVAYVNGVEVTRAGLGLQGGDPPAWDAFAQWSNEARLQEGGSPQYFDLDASIGLLHEGTNVVAMEVHDIDAESSDLTLIPFLTLGFATDRGTEAAEVLALPAVDLHTSFSVRASGERVRLFDPSGCEADDLDPLPLRGDETYGRQPDGIGALGYFLEPTPGAPNVTEARPGFAEAPVLDPPAGHYGGGADVTITADPLARVHYAWEGWEPTEGSERYTGPLSTGAAGEAVVLRARAFQDGLWPSRIATATYLLEEPGNLPILSVVTDPPNLWDEETGIYVPGIDAKPEFPWSGANFYQEWVRSAHFEEWEPDGTLGFSVDGSIQIHGGNSRRRDQRNLELSVKGGFSDQDDFDHQVFPELGLTEFPRLVLRAGGGDWLGCFSEGCMDGALLRDSLMHRLTLGTDLDRMASRPARTYLNGEYWGTYFINEKGDRAYVESHYGEEDFDLLRGGGMPVQGDEMAWLEMMAWLRDQDMTDPATWAQVQARIDVEELQSYLIFQVFYANTDWPGNNIKYWRPRAPGGRWRWMLFGTDFGLGLKQPASHDTLAFALADDGDDWPNPPWSTELFRLLFESPEFTHTFVNRYADFLNTLLHPDRTHAVLHDLAGELAPDMPRHVERWGTWTDGVTTYRLAGDEWWSAIVDIDDWLADRPAHARQHVVDQLDLDGTWTLRLAADPPGSGTFELHAVTVEAPFTGLYFQGVPVTITAHAEPGYRFAGWSDRALPATATITVAGVGELGLTARFD